MSESITNLCHGLLYDLNTVGSKSQWVIEETMSNSEDEELPSPPEPHQVNPQILDSVQLEQLIKQPLTGDEAGDTLPPDPGTLEVICRRLSAPSMPDSQTTLSDRSWHEVYYLYGDERRAIRKAIRRNNEIIRDVFENSVEGYPFEGAWSENQFNILCEEWEYYRRREIEEQTRDSLPEDFFQNLSAKKEAILRILVNAEEEWVSGTDIRERMREEHGIIVSNKPGVISIHLSQFSQLYSDAFRRNLILDRWVNHPFMPQREPKFRIGDKYHQEVQKWFSLDE